MLTLYQIHVQTSAGGQSEDQGHRRNKPQKSIKYIFFFCPEGCLEAFLRPYKKKYNTWIQNLVLCLV